MAPKLTVITPSLNQGAFLERTIRSVLDQGHPNLEYVIVDGGSSDQSVEIIRRYEDRLAWWVSEPDQGQSDAINKGIERTSGELVAYVNSDDYYLPGAFKTAIAALEGATERWAAGSARDRDPEGRPAGSGSWQAQLPSAWERRIRGRHWWVFFPWSTPQPSAFWRRDLFEQFGPFRRDMHFAFDAEFMLRLVYAGEMPLILEDELSVRVAHPEQKAADKSRWEPERRRLIELYRPVMTPVERRKLALVRVLWALGAYRIKLPSIAPLLRFGGDLLEHVPERWRPPIRRRDRERRT